MHLKYEGKGIQSTKNNMQCENLISVAFGIDELANKLLRCVSKFDDIGLKLRESKEGRFLLIMKY